jgi:hypothetical protein
MPYSVLCYNAQSSFWRNEPNWSCSPSPQRPYRRVKSAMSNGRSEWRQRRSRRSHSRPSSSSMPLFDIDRDINGLPAEKCLAARRGRSAPRDWHLLQVA